MLDRYIESFTTGSIDAHKESQKWWIKDTSPVVETNMGFIETCRDPHGVRAEWDGLVAIVNKDESQKFSVLVDMSDELLLKLPWNSIAGGVQENTKSAFEKPKFMKPDFTSLESKILL